MPVDDLCRFFAHPAKFLCVKRLGMRLDDSSLLFPEHEPFFIEGLEAYSLSQELVETIKAGGSANERFAFHRARGDLPHGSVGQCAYNDRAAEVEAFVKKLTVPALSASLPPKQVDLAIRGFHLTGAIKGLTAGGLVQYRYANAKPQDYLDLWIRHCVLCALAQDKADVTSYLFAKDASFKYKKAPDATRVLGDLLDLYFEGLARPLRFFPKTSWSFAFAVLENGEDRERALGRARPEWTGNDFGIRGESNDPYFNLCFSAFVPDPLNDDFTKVSLAVLSPLADSMEDFSS